MITARQAGLIGCLRCGRAQPAANPACMRCGSTLVSRKTGALQNVWAWLIAGILAYIPANIYPMLLTRTLVREEESTIVGGAIELIHHGSYGIAAIILIASIGIPIGKFVAIATLAISIRKPSRISTHHRHKLYEIVEFIGRWSMIDVFVVAILAALVQLNTLAAINPGPAAVTFALSVIFTMLSAQSFDPRMIWDDQTKQEAK